MQKMHTVHMRTLQNALGVRLRGPQGTPSNFEDVRHKLAETGALTHG